jgi:hypothetical protein
MDERGITMSFFMENRLKVTIVLLFWFFFVYISQAVILSGQITYEHNIEMSDTENYTQYNVSTEGDIDVSDTGDLWAVFGFLTTLFGLATFQFLGLPTWALIFLNFLNVIMLSIVVYVIVSYVYDIIKALPFT